MEARPDLESLRAENERLRAERDEFRRRAADAELGKHDMNQHVALTRQQLAAAEAKLVARDRWVRDVAVCYDLPYDGDDLFAAVARFLKRIRQELSAEREKRRAAEAREAELRAALRQAAEDVRQWGCYADEYHRSKWDLKGNVDRLRKLAAPACPGEAGKETTCA